jgi:hypothetical protein
LTALSWAAHAPPRQQGSKPSHALRISEAMKRQPQDSEAIVLQAAKIWLPTLDPIAEAMITGLLAEVAATGANLAVELRNALAGWLALGIIWCCRTGRPAAHRHAGGRRPGQLFLGGERTFGGRTFRHGLQPEKLGRAFGNELRAAHVAAHGPQILLPRVVHDLFVACAIHIGLGARPRSRNGCAGSGARRSRPAGVSTRLT